MAEKHSQKNDALLPLIRELLRGDNVKLWLPPHTSETGDPLPFPQDFVEKYSRKTGEHTLVVEATLNELRSRAVQRLAQNKKFEETGIAVLHFTFVCNEGDNDRKNDEFDLEISLKSVLGSELIQMVAKRCNVGAKEIRLIGGSSILALDKLLLSQNLTNHSQLLVVKMKEAEIAANERMEWEQSVEKTRAAALRLAGKAGAMNDNDARLELEDQLGNIVEIPSGEKETLSVGMTMHERGRAAVKEKNFGLALVFLLEADAEFKKCRHEILKAVDNYAILNLDIVWCYLNLKKIDSLPDAENRLNQCEESFRSVYGQNYERLSRIRQGVLLERALIVRLKILQGIVSFLQRKYVKARNLLKEGSADINEMEVDDTQLAQIVEMGYNVDEARLALRGTRGNLNEAVAFIVNERKEEENREIKRKKNRLTRRLGKTSDGNEMNVDVYEQLLEMGFQKGVVIEALRQSNNDMNQALELIQNGGVSLSQDSSSNQTQNAIVESMKDELLKMGFDEKKIKNILKEAGVDLDAAIDILTKGGGGKTFSEEEIADNEAWKELHKDVSDNARDHLDLTFSEEKLLIDEYMALTLVHL